MQDDDARANFHQLVQEGFIAQPTPNPNLEGAAWFDQSVPPYQQSQFFQDLKALMAANKVNRLDVFWKLDWVK